MRCIFLISFSLLIVSSAYSQNSFSLGTQVGVGVTIPKVNSNIYLMNKEHDLLRHPVFSLGLSAQYVLAELIGLESGIRVTCVDFSVKGDDKHAVTNDLRMYSELEFMVYQIPVQLLYLVKHPSDRDKYFKLTAGTSLEWFDPILRGGTVFNTNFVAGLRLAGAPGDYGRLELAFEYENSLGRYKYISHRFNETAILSTRNSTFYLTVHYFFLNRSV